jgi:hypothetical protein
MTTLASTNQPSTLLLPFLLLPFLLLLLLLQNCASTQVPPPLARAVLSIVILHTRLHISPDVCHLQVKWVVSSDAPYLDDGTAFPPPSYTPPCPLFSWDGAAISGPDTYPNTHCGSLFAVMLPIPSAALAPGTHTLSLSLADLPASPANFYKQNGSTDFVSFVLGSAADAAVNFTLTPGGANPLSASIILLRQLRSTAPQEFPRSSIAYGCPPPPSPPSPSPLPTSAIGARGVPATSTTAGVLSRGLRPISKSEEQLLSLLSNAKTFETLNPEQLYARL